MLTFLDVLEYTFWQKNGKTIIVFSIVALIALAAMVYLFIRKKNKKP
jgi:LPXTG-motif cell wall-anchored protein